MNWKKEDDINPRVGFVFSKKVGDKVNQGDVIGFIYSDNEEKTKEIL
jgi:thymidine phosphorylase